MGCCLTALWVMWVLTPLSIAAQTLNLRIDTSNAARTVALLQTRDTSARRATALLELPATRGLLAHNGQFDPAINATNFVRELTDSAAATDAFGFRRIRRELPAVGQTLRLLTDHLPQLSRRIGQALASYTLRSDPRPITVHLLLGGNSDGFATSDSTFYLELQYFGTDTAGILNIITHEVYHIVQQRHYELSDRVYARLSATDKANYTVVQDLFLEGSATYVANPLPLHGGEYTQFQQKKYARNLRRLDDAFYLLDRLLVRRPDEANEDRAYAIGYGGHWDSPLYFVGFRMCAELERVHGMGTIRQYLSRSPLDFALAYIALYRQHPDVGPRFSVRTERLIRALHRRAARSS